MKYKIADVSDILKSRNFGVFVHGVNCQNSFGSGIAGIIKNVIPKAKAAYHNHVRIRGDESVGGDNKNLLGTLCEYDLQAGAKIVHAFTQYDRGYDGKKYGSYDAIDDCFAIIAEEYRDRQISFPLIGAGLAGLKWNTVSTIIDNRLEGLDYHCILRQEDVVKYGLQGETQASELMALLEASPEMKKNAKDKRLDWFYKNVGEW
jgi:O-acetyl-ADP-ribose deacetylase (regulator of RNase III)